MAMKKIKSKKRPRQPIQTTTTNSGSSTPQELNSFSVAAAISEASAPQEQQQQISPSRKFISTITSPLRKSNPSQVSLATSNSFATANEHNDLLSELAKPSPTSVQTPTEITFSNNSEETMPSKKSTTSKTYPVTATAVPPTTTGVTKPEPKSDEPHFDVAQNTYGCVKDIWAWGTTVPVVSNLLGITEAVAAKVTETTIKMDLPAIDQEAVVPNLKKLDDEVVTPAILAVWNIISPAVGKADDMIVKPVMTEVVPRVVSTVMMPLSIFDDKKKQEKKMIETTPEVALN